jgi:hypothetical protein
MKLITNRISTGKAKRFEDFVAEYKSEHIKTASVKTAEQDEADSSGQLDVEPLHQEGESTTMPKNGPNAKKESDDKSAAATKSPDEEGCDSGQPKAEGSEKFTNDPEVPSKEEKGGETEEEVKVAEAICEKCKSPCGECKCEGKCDCKPCTASREVEVKTAETKEAELTPAQEKLPDALKAKIEGADGNNKEEDDDEGETKEAGKIKGPGVPDGTGPGKDSEECPFNKKKKKDEDKKATQKTEFVKIANLDDKNKGFLKEYWRQLFGDEYANALIADK